MTEKEFKSLCSNVINELRNVAPKDTGNLAYNAIKFEFVSPDECRIYVNEEIAPYMPYTNEPWRSSRWNGRKNPNEGWWNKAAEMIAEIIEHQYGAKQIKRG